MNEFNFNVTGAQRKTLVGAISELTNSKIAYNGAPSFSYDCGDYHIDKSGLVTGEYDRNLFEGQDLDVPTYLRKGIKVTV